MNMCTVIAVKKTDGKWKPIKITYLGCDFAYKSMIWNDGFATS